MRRLPMLLFTIAAAALIGIMTLTLLEPATSTVEIDRDRAFLKAEIEAAQAEGNKYSGGVIKTLLEAKIAVWANTAAMLDQKRASFIHRIALRYTIDGHELTQPSDSEISEINGQLEQIEKQAKSSKDEAARYSGGLLQITALLKAATDELTASQLRLKLFSARYGIPMQLPSPQISQPSKPPGLIVKDREGL
jgi:hypothetical protein